MKPPKLFVLVTGLMLFILVPACAPSQAELDATATRVAANIFATQTAQAPTITPTSAPTSAPTATPTTTPTPTSDLESRTYSGNVTGGDITFAISKDAQSIEPSWSVGLAPGWSEVVSKDKVICTGGTAPDMLTKRFDRAVPITNGTFEYVDTSVEWRGQFSFTHIASGTLKLTDSDGGTTCTIGPLEWMAVPWPKTVDEAVETLLNILSEKDQEYLRTLPEKDLPLLHMGLGMWIRNTFGLWAGNRDLLTSCGSPDMHPDNCSGVILEALVKRVKSKPTPTPSAEKGTVPVGKNPSAIAFDGKWLWIANYDDSTVQAIDPDTREVTVQPIKVGAAPTDLAFDGQRMWVLSTEMSTAQAIDIAAGIAGQPVKVGRSPSRMVYDGRRLWVTNVDDTTVQAIDPDTGIASEPVRVGGGPWALAVDRPGKRLWVANILSDTVQAIDVESGETYPPIRVGDRPTALAFDGKQLWVLNFGDYTVQSVDPNTLQVGMPIPVGKEPFALIFDGSQLWVANRWDHTVQAIDPRTTETYPSIAVNDAPWALASDGQRLWVAISDSNAVQYIRTGE
jgi:YVTN family beta-propeller protein